MVYVLPTHQPLRLFEEICMVDHLSGGRLDMGVGRGASPYEIGLFGVCSQESRDVFEESLAVLQKCMVNDTLSHRGAFFKYYDVPLSLRPLQPGGPPMWYGAFSERNLEFAARQRLNVMLNGPPPRLRKLRQRYREIWAQLYPDSSLPRVGSLYQIFVGETDTEAERVAGGAFNFWYGSMTHLWRANNAMPRESLPPDFPTALKRGSFIAGSAKTVRDRLESILSESGIERLLLQCNLGNMAHEEAVASVQRFKSGVMPYLKVAEQASRMELLAS